MEGADRLAARVAAAAELAARAYGMPPDRLIATIEPDPEWPSPFMRVSVAGARAEFQLAENPGMAQELHSGLGRIARTSASRRGSSAPVTTDAWCVHPVAAGLLDAWDAVPRILPPLHRDGGATSSRVRAKGPRGGASLTFEHGIVVVERAQLRDANGRTGLVLKQVDGTVGVELPGDWPQSLALALVGRTAGDLCSTFADQARARGSRIVSAAAVGTGGSERLQVLFEDELVPVLPTSPGGEAWRPVRNEGRIRRSPRRGSTHLLRHAFASTISSHLAMPGMAATTIPAPRPGQD